MSFITTNFNFESKMFLFVRIIYESRKICVLNKHKRRNMFVL